MRLVDEAKERYLTDAAFHVRVDTTVKTMEQDHGIRFDQADRELATEAAACALIVGEQMYR